MEDGNDENDNTNNKIENEEVDLRAAVQYAVMKIIREEDERSALQLNNNPDEPPSVCKNSTINSIAELCFMFATQSLGPDLVAFANHANHRKTISEVDVQLVARKNATVQQKLNEFCQANIAAAPTAKKAPRRPRPKVVDKEKEGDDEHKEELLDLSSAAKKPKPLRKPSKKGETIDLLNDDFSSSSSSSDGELDTIRTRVTKPLLHKRPPANQKKTTATNRRAKPKTTTMDSSSSSSSSEDELADKAVPLRKRSKLVARSSPGGKVPPRRRFRMSSNLATTSTTTVAAPSKDLDSDSDDTTPEKDDDDDDDNSFEKAASRRIRELTNLEDTPIKE